MSEELNKNKNVVLIIGRPASGKSMALRNLNQEESVYFNCDLKELPFKSNFAENVPITDPMDIIDYINEINDVPSVKNGIVDTITFLMNAVETQYVLTATNTQAAWQKYASFYKELIHAIKSGSKNYAILAHEADVVNEVEGTLEKVVPIKGSVGKVGCEADFTTILAAKRMPVKKLRKYVEGNDLLNITEEEEEDEFKYVFQTRVTKDTLGEKSRSAVGLWKRNELYIDNDLNAVFKRLNEYYS